MDRLESFLVEGEVPEEVSSLKRAPVDVNSPIDIRLGIIDGASFIWNSAAEDDKKPTADTTRESAFTVEPAPDDSVSVTSQGRSNKSRFELKDVDVVFPEGKLSLVIGASKW